MDIVKLISSKIVELSENGKIDEIVEKYTLQCVDSIVEKSLTWSGEGKKVIEKGIKDKLSLPLENIKVDRYQKMVSNIVEERLKETIHKDAVKNINETIDGITGFLEKKEFKLSEIITEFIDRIDKSYDGEMEEQYGETSMHVNDNNKGWVVVSFDKESDKRNFECSNTIYIRDGKLSMATIEGIPFSPHALPLSDSFTEYLFRLYCNNVSVTIDESDCETEYCRVDADY